MKFRSIAVLTVVMLLAGCKGAEAPPSAEPPVADNAAVSDAIAVASRTANEVAVAQYRRLISGCKAQTTLVEDVRDAKGVIDVAVKEWEAVPGTDEEKTMKGACASMLYDLQALAQSCLEDGPRWGDFEEQKSRDYVEDSQACNSQLNMK